MEQAKAIRDAGRVCGCIIKGLQKDRDISEYFQIKKISKKAMYLHQQMPRAQTR